jgi:hypothetical protein
LPPLEYLNNGIAGVILNVKRQHRCPTWYSLSTTLYFTTEKHIMSMRPPIFTKGDISSADPLVRGRALAAEQATMGLNPSKHKRETVRLTANSAGATPAELTILGQPAFRLRTIQSSTMMLVGAAVYHSSATRNTWQVIAAVQDIDGVLTLVGTPVLTKFGAGAAALAVTTDALTESLVFTGTGVAGDVNGHWELFIDALVEVTEDAR